MNDRIKRFDEELDALYEVISGRRPFSYRAQDDALYRSAAELARVNGRNAMRDTLGRGAALTGGYGSSYAQLAGQQQYDEYLRRLSELLPDYYDRARERYREEGEELQAAYERSFKRRQAAVEEEQAAEKAAYQRQKDNYQRLSQLISGTGYVPSDAELGEAGMSREQAAALRSTWQSKQKPAGGTTSGSSGGNGASKTQTKPRTDPSKWPIKEKRKSAPEYERWKSGPIETL